MNVVKRSEEVISTWEWVGSFLLASIPFVGLVVLLIWAFDGSTNRNKANFARACLIIGLSIFVIIFSLLWIGYQNSCR